MMPPYGYFFFMSATLLICLRLLCADACRRARHAAATDAFMMLSIRSLCAYLWRYARVEDYGERGSAAPQERAAARSGAVLPRFTLLRHDDVAACR